MFEFRRSSSGWRDALVYLRLSLCSAVLCGCQTFDKPSAHYRRFLALTEHAQWQPLRIDSGRFVLTASTPAAFESAPILTVYIEGDGLAWLTPARASADPSPRNPLALQLALRHPDSAVAWLGRPCQYVTHADWRTCAQTDWTSGRFSEAVIAASDHAVTVLAQRAGAGQVILVGYSGGAAVAALVAARRRDVLQLITVAGNLDHAQWTQSHGVVPLTASLNPADAVASLANVKQIHWVSGHDRTVARNVAEAYAARFPPSQRPLICRWDEATHAKGWIENWPALLNASRELQCADKSTRRR